MLNKIILAGIILLFQCCNTNTGTDESRQLAIKHCSGCHAFPEPYLLDNKTWIHNVLPPMAEMVGIDAIYGTYLRQTPKPVITLDEWKKISLYYATASPAKMPLQNRKAVQAFTSLFSTRTIAVAENAVPATSYIKIDEGNRRLYVADAFDSSLLVYDKDLNLAAKNKISNILVDISFTTSLKQKGERRGYLTNIGKMNPTDVKTGSVDSFSMAENGVLNYHKKSLVTSPGLYRLFLQILIMMVVPTTSLMVSVIKKARCTGLKIPVLINTCRNTCCSCQVQ